MSMETDRIESDLRDSRHRLSDTLDALGTKLSPGQMLDEVLGLAQGQAGHFTANLGRQVRDNPLPAILIAAGAALLFVNRGKSANDGNAEDWHFERRNRMLDEARATTARLNGESDEAFDDRLHTAYAKVLDIKQSAGEAMSDFKHRVAGLVSHTKHAAAGAGERLSHAVSNAAHAAKDQGRNLGAGVSNARHKAEDLFQGTPLAGGAVAVAIGALIGSATPLSDTERDKLGNVADKAARVSGDLAAKGARAVKDAVANPVH